MDKTISREQLTKLLRNMNPAQRAFFESKITLTTARVNRAVRSLTQHLPGADRASP